MERMGCRGSGTLKVRSVYLNACLPEAAAQRADRFCAGKRNSQTSTYETKYGNCNGTHRLDVLLTVALSVGESYSRLVSVAVDDVDESWVRADWPCWG